MVSVCNFCSTITARGGPSLYFCSHLVNTTMKLPHFYLSVKKNIYFSKTELFQAICSAIIHVVFIYTYLLNYRVHWQSRTRSR